MIDGCNISRVEPSVLVDGFLGVFRVTVVPRDDHRAADEQSFKQTARQDTEPSAC
jgi:hypothetical protein